jgi:hypothetical protein
LEIDGTGSPGEIWMQQAVHKAIRNPMVPLFLLFLTIYVSSAGGHLYSIDEVIIYSTTQAIANSGSLNIAFALPLIHSLGFLTWVPENTSAYYSKYGLLQPVLALPLYYLGTWLGITQWRVVDLLYSPIMSAASVCLVFAISRRLGRSTAISVAVSLLYGFATIAWPYAKFFYEVTTASAMLLATTYFLFDPATRRSSTLLSGLFATLSVFARITQTIVLPAIFLYLVFKRPRSRQSIVNAALFLIPVAAGAMVYAYLNLARFGSPLDFGYLGEGNLFSEGYMMNPIIGAYGMLLSSGEGLFIYYPLCAVGLSTLLGASSKSDENWPRFIFAWFFFANLLFFARYSAWHGWGAWGARFLVICTPYLILASAPFLESAKTSIVKTVTLIFATGMGAFSNLMGVIINFNYTQAYLVGLGAYDLSRFPEPGIWIPTFSPLRGSWILLWSQTYAEFYSYAPAIFFLKGRYDLLLFNVLGLPALLVTAVLAILETYWLAGTLRTSNSRSHD